MTENEIGRIVVDCAYKVHQKLGPGLLESVYEVALVHEIKKRGLSVERQIPIPIVYDDLRFDDGFRADIVVANSVILELKSVEQIQPVHKKQLLTYLRLSNRRLGFLINFGAELIKDGLSRVSNGASDWREDGSLEHGAQRREIL
jgi:GxxExxY protein